MVQFCPQKKTGFTSILSNLPFETIMVSGIFIILNLSELKKERN